MKRIAVICAPPSLPNPGMSSVDLAIIKLIHSKYQYVQLTVYHLYSIFMKNPNIAKSKLPDVIQRSEVPYDICYFDGNFDALYENDLIIYWGDFLHSRAYLYESIPIVQKLFSLDEYEAIKFIYKYYYLNEASVTVLNKTVIFGGSLIFNRTQDYSQDYHYQKSIERLYKNAHTVWMRDMPSARQVSLLLHEAKRNFLGVDAALLNYCSYNLRNEETDLHINDVVGIFFGRNVIDNNFLERALFKFISELNCRVEWLSWFPEFMQPQFYNELEEIFQMKHTKIYIVPTLINLLQRIKHYKFIITDTYHVCLNAWGAGVPTICLGKQSSEVSFDYCVGWKFNYRDKRYDFYSMYNALNYYLDVGILKDSNDVQKYIRHFKDALSDHETIAFIINNIRSYATLIYDELTISIDKVIKNS